MRVTIGSTLLGDYNDEIYIGGFRASAQGDTQTGRGTCSGGLARLRMRGNVVSQFSVPTNRTFTSVSEAQKFINDTAKIGGYEGLLIFEYVDGSETRFPWAVARPSDLNHRGVNVTANWDIQAGERLT